jgi:PilZ domain
MATMIVDDQRTKVQREPRRELRKRPTWMTVDSPGGAKVVTDAALDVRDSFDLALVPEHTTRQSCEVVWRRGKTYGVKFLP